MPDARFGRGFIHSAFHQQDAGRAARDSLYLTIIRERSKAMSAKPADEPTLLEGRDYTVEAGCWIFTADFLRRRGYCCGNGCRHCPYREGDEATATNPATRPSPV